MAKYKIIPSSRTIVQSPISIGHKAEKGVEAIEFDLTAWVETYGSGTLTVIMRRWGDAIPYPIALEIDKNNKATWTLSDIDTAKAGMAYAQLSYVVGDEVVKKSDIYTFRVMDSLTGEGEPPEAYESWLEHLTHLAAEAMAEVLDIEGIVMDKTLTVDGGIADAKATGDALSALEDAVTEEIDKLKADLANVGMSSTAKAALLACFRNVAWINENGQDCYSALEIALEYPKIMATFNPGANVIYTDDALDTLKQYMTVKYVPSQGASGTIISANDYTLSGVLSEGTNVVVVNYGNYNTVISVTAVDFYNIWEWSTEYSGVGKLIKTTSISDINENPRRGFNCLLNAGTKRFGVCVNKGKKIAHDRSNGNSPVANTYPIPIPKTATKVTISVTPSTDYLFGYVGRYDAGSDDRGYDYVMLNESASWTHQGTYTCTFDAGENLFLGYNGKKPDNSAYSDAEREERVVTILFEREVG